MAQAYVDKYRHLYETPEENEKNEEKRNKNLMLELFGGISEDGETISNDKQQNIKITISKNTGTSWASTVKCSKCREQI